MNSAETFIDDLITKVASHSRYRVGFDFLCKVIRDFRGGVRARHKPIDGFRPALAANNQGGELYRHLELHIGLKLLGGPFILLSHLANLMDHQQASQGRVEAKTELLNNYASFLCADKVLDYYHAHLPYEELRKELQDILATDNK